MKKVIVEKQYLNYAIGDVILVRDQDAALLIPRGVVSEVLEAEPDQVKPAGKMTTKTIIKGKK